eukprot:10054270-Alexandrium_andersonii.AAC.1
MALYGAESTGISDRALRRLRTEVIHSADPRLSHSRNPEAALEAFAELEDEIDPLDHVAERRLVMLRRTVALHPQ